MLWVRHLAPQLMMAVSFTSGDGQKLVSGASDGTVCIWEAATARELKRFQTAANIEDLACWLVCTVRSTIRCCFQYRLPIQVAGRHSTVMLRPSTGSAFHPTVVLTGRLASGIRSRVLRSRAFEDTATGCGPPCSLPTASKFFRAVEAPRMTTPVRTGHLGSGTLSRPSRRHFRVSGCENVP